MKLWPSSFHGPVKSEDQGARLGCWKKGQETLTEEDDSGKSCFNTSPLRGL